MSTVGEENFDKLIIAMFFPHFLAELCSERSSAQTRVTLCVAETGGVEGERLVEVTE